MKRYHFIVLAMLLSLVATAQQTIPHLKQDNGQYKLYVNDTPFTILGGELGNSSASDTSYMNQVWKKLQTMHVNTVLTPIYWELLEPQEGKFDFSLVDYFLKKAREKNMKLVLLWFGSWKNSMSCYTPAWVKTNQLRFPRATNKMGRSQEILSPFSEENLSADVKAFQALMRYLKENDSAQTVIMIQVENEIGMLPDARDYHPNATKAFQNEVPLQLINYLKQHKNISGVVKKSWLDNGARARGTWEDVFGKGLHTDEIFIAWHFASFANKVTKAGKDIYNIPMFVNAALNRPNVKPGDYPSGGPLPHIIDVWKAAAPSIDFLSPDFYNPDFKYWNDLYTRKDNPLFIPEIKFEPSVSAKAFYAIGHYKSLGFSPFSIESTDNPATEPIGRSYDVLSQINELLVHHKEFKVVDGVLLDKDSSVQRIAIDDYIFTFKHDYTLNWSPKAKEDVWPTSGALIVRASENEYYVAGTGIVITFESKNKNEIAGILEIQAGNVINGNWRRGRIMNGDQDHQGRHLRIPVDEYGIQKLKLYKYK